MSRVVPLQVTPQVMKPRTELLAAPAVRRERRKAAREAIEPLDPVAKRTRSKKEE